MFFSIINDSMGSNLEKSLLISREKIFSRVKELALQISSDYVGENPIFIGILNGAVFFFSDLLREISIPARIDFVRAASYGSGRTPGESVNVAMDIEVLLKGRHVIIIEDIIDTGWTLSKIVRLLNDREPSSLKVCVLINKQERREAEVKIDYCGFQVEEGFLVGYGLDYDEQYRCLPDIFTLK